ncbi:hypothetical protein CDAR_13421 [Caerostris darwini]|uniref:Uncharacterized protein n=1 Tax=Caerostris darwini TaxID=1538125 RepID=A0AAV4UDN5_9ARAC|nr:hypothetical protein CDAR_13421 [Caerostris darwini]
MEEDENLVVLVKAKMIPAIVAKPIKEALSKTTVDRLCPRLCAPPTKTCPELVIFDGTSQVSDQSSQSLIRVKCRIEWYFE